MTASLATRVFHAVPSPSFSAAKYSPPWPETLTFFEAPLGYKRGREDETIRMILKKCLRNLILDFTDVRRAAQTSSPAGFFRAGCPQGRLGKAKPSMLAPAVIPFSSL